MEEQMEGQMSLEMCFPGLLSGKMSQEHSAATEARTSDVSWKSFATLKGKTLSFLNLKTESGIKPESSSVMDLVLRGDCLMLNTGESPNEERESQLSEILQGGVPEKYYLSEKACEGILRRANKRGKELPEVLEKALTAQIERSRLRSEGGADTYIKSDGSVGTAGKGPLIQDNLSGTLGVSQDQTLFCSNVDTKKEIKDFVRDNNKNIDHQQDMLYTEEDKCGSSAAGTHGSAGHLHNIIIPMQDDGTTSMTKHGPGWHEEDVGYTVNTVDRQSVAYGIGRDAFNMGENAQFGMSIE